MVILEGFILLGKFRQRAASNQGEFDEPRK
jgi:hypothetical protein